jgi:hypothetical protein
MNTKDDKSRTAREIDTIDLDIGIFKVCLYAVGNGSSIKD